MVALDMESHDSVQSHLNSGVLRLRLPDEDFAAKGGPLTAIVSGVGRSGTSMVAKVLHSLGLFMGRIDGLAVYEDREFNQALYIRDYVTLDALIRKQNAANERWGFKFASLQNHLSPAQLNSFRNPRLIVVARDVVATTSRSKLSDAEKRDLEATLRDVTQQVSDMMAFVSSAPCPTLLLSYEKCVAFPDAAIDALAGFCGIVPTADARRQALHAIEPNNPSYIQLFHPNHRGNVDAVKHGVVIGWCAANDSDEPVEVELLADGVPIARTMANAHRNDLETVGIGSGCHGFRFDLTNLPFELDTVLTLRTVDRAYILNRGEFRLSDFPEELARLTHRGNFDSVRDGYVTGWCVARGSTDPVEVELLADGVVVASAMADIHRHDLEAAGIGTGRHGYRIDISSLGLAATALLEVRAARTTCILRGSRRRLSDFPAQVDRTEYSGNFDLVKHGRVIGWCAAQGRDTPVEVELLADGAVVASAKADLHRGDLLAAGVGAGRHGFEIDISGLALTPEAVLQVRTLGGAHVLRRSGRRLMDFPER